MYDPNIYRYAVYPVVKKWINEHPDDSTDEYLKVLVPLTSCPILVMCIFVQEITDRDLSEQIRKLEVFYGHRS
jgi:hypothetical protein